MKSRRLRSPLRYIGGKSFMANKLLQFVPPHHIYVEVFGGGASLLIAKKPSPVEVYNDIDSGAVNFFRVLRDPQKVESFYRLVSLTPVSREEFRFCRDTWKQCEDEIERAYRWFVMVRQSFGGKLGRGDWCITITESSRGMAHSVSAWWSAIELLPEISKRFLCVVIENRDFRDIICLYDTEETFMYLDPPYMPTTRKNKQDYDFEMTTDDHKELVNLILSSKSMFMLSGYDNDIYRELESAGWEKHCFKTVCRSIGRTKNSKFCGKGGIKEHGGRIECVWLSPNLIENLNGGQLCLTLDKT